MTYARGDVCIWIAVPKVVEFLYVTHHRSRFKERDTCHRALYTFCHSVGSSNLENGHKANGVWTLN